MKPMDSLKKPAMMVRLRNSKGFSLIEMAIVLVIIGIIIGAIIKGQDLIANSNAKKVISATSTWRNLAMTFLDRNGRFPGDIQKNGIIGDQAAFVGPPAIAAETIAASSALAELAPVMETTPANPIVVGSTSFWVYMGNTSAGTIPVARNAILVCGSVDCATAFTADQLEIIKAMDTAYDGSADGGLGNFRAVLTPATLVPAPSLVSGRMTTTFDGAGVAAVDITGPGLATPWAITHTAAVWLFDKPF